MYQNELRVLKSVYSSEVLLKAAYAFLDTDYIHIDEEEDYWVIQMTSKKDIREDRTRDFENELLSQMVRLNVYQRTKSIREILMARALTSTVIDEEDPIETIRADQEDVSDEELDAILTDWFDKNE